MPLPTRLFSWLPCKLRRHSATPSQFAELEQRIGYAFRDTALLRTALTHPSIKSTNPTARDYQRLEFLGDAVLGLVLAEALYGNDGADEGFLTDARTRLARGTNLAAVGRKLELGRHLFLAANADARRIRDTDTAHEDALEALFGAVFLDGGLDAARAVAKNIFEDEMRVDIGVVAQSRSAKNRLQELVQQNNKSGTSAPRIEYRTVEESGPPHDRRFTIEVWVDGTCRGRGAGNSKRIASELAASTALQRDEELGTRD
jgi:ribonuclease-3